ncbi:MAG: hypothetical protein ACUVT1_13125, partial [Anaerolineae bacterium]
MRLRSLPPPSPGFHPRRPTLSRLLIACALLAGLSWAMSACSPADAPATASGAPVPTSISVKEDSAAESAPAAPSPTPAPIPYGIYAM